jgi:hypothetical protein
MLYVLHIPKTGTSSLMAAFQQARGPSVAQCLWHFWLRLSPSFSDVLTRLRKQQPSLGVLGAHVSSAELAPCLTLDDTVVTVFRDPFAQAESCFAFLTDLYGMPCTHATWLATMLARPLTTLWDRAALESQCKHVQVYEHSRVQQAYDQYELANTFHINRRRHQPHVFPIDRETSLRLFCFLNPDELDMYQAETGVAPQVPVSPLQTCDQAVQVLRDQFGVQLPVPSVPSDCSATTLRALVHKALALQLPADMSFAQHNSLHLFMERYDTTWRLHAQVRAAALTHMALITAALVVLLLVLLCLWYAVQRQRGARSHTL